MPRPSDIQARLKLARQAAAQTRALTLPIFARGIDGENKNKTGIYDPVTQADKDAEKLLRTLISKAFPGDSISGEEYPDKHGDNDWSWCLDPIDGTRAFIAGVPVWSTLIAASFRGRPVIGLVDIPALDERYLGIPGQAWCETPAGTTRIKTRQCPRLDTAILSCTEPMAMFSPGQKGAYEMIRRTARFTRLGLDAYGYALTARGKIDLVIEAGLAPYDIMAHIPIILAAGGAVQGWHGQDAQTGGAIVCAGDPKLLEQVYPYLRRALD